ncbi:hypothetical protein AB0395_01770 [Streptosporangium sp. NPDC051023]|uniref:hypothetical protein n=1 Tax=Streptosporangium sp. NPDC051023 TaxID=3155410 RepID=UPI00345012BD
MTAEIADWLFHTIRREVTGAETLAAETDLVAVLGERTLGLGEGGRFIDHIRSNSEAKIRIVELFTRNRAVLDGFEDRIREGGSLTAGEAHALAVAAIRDEVLSEALAETAYGYRLRPGWKEEWKP